MSSCTLKKDQMQNGKQKRNMLKKQIWKVRTDFETLEIKTLN